MQGILRGAALFLLLVFTASSASAAALKKPRLETSSQPEKATISGNEGTASRVSAQQEASTQSSTLGANLIPNPSVETAGTNGVPSGWAKGGYGSSTRTLTYPVSGTGGASTKAIQVSVSNYGSGDAKWYFGYVPISAESKYQFSDYSKATVPSIITAQFKLGDGSFAYKDLATVPASPGFQLNTAMIVPPPNTVSVTIFHLLKQNGTLVTDEYSLNEVTSTDPTPEPGNMVANGNFETAGTNGLPASWSKGGYGSNTRVLTYPVPGASGSGVKIDVSNYVSGDVKWVFADVPVTPGETLTYSDSYLSNVPTIVTAQFALPNGAFSYKDIATLPAAANWTQAAADVTPPAGATSVTIFHLIKQNGSFSMDNVTLKKKVSGTGVFQNGAVSLRFDDGLDSQYVNALPKLQSAGLKGTFYIVSNQTEDSGFADVMSIAEIKDLYAKGHEIGAHTRNHPDLATLTAAQQQAEIQGSRQDILAWNVGPVNSFSYPYGSYNATTIQIVKDAGFVSATATIGGNVTQSSDRYQLERFSVNNDTTFAIAKNWIDTAAANKQWLILTFHGVDLSGTTYSTTPTVFNQIIDYIKQKGISVVTVSEGTQSLR